LALKEELGGFDEKISEMVAAQEFDEENTKEKFRETKEYRYTQEMIGKQRLRIDREEVRREPLFKYLDDFRAEVDKTVDEIGMEWKSLKERMKILHNFTSVFEKENGKIAAFRGAPIAATGVTGLFVYYGFDMPKEVLSGMTNGAFTAIDGFKVGIWFTVFAGAMYKTFKTAFEYGVSLLKRRRRLELINRCLEEKRKIIDKLKNDYKRRFCEAEQRMKAMEGRARDRSIDRNPEQGF